MAKIKEVKGFELLDPRGNPRVGAEFFEARQGECA
jgi:hypothetical protein